MNSQDEYFILFLVSGLGYLVSLTSVLSNSHTHARHKGKGGKKHLIKNEL